MRIVVTRDENSIDFCAYDAEGRELAGFCCGLAWAAANQERMEKDIRQLARTNGCQEILDPVFGGQVLTIDEYLGEATTQSS